MRTEDRRTLAVQQRAKRLALTGAAIDYRNALRQAETMLKQEAQARAEVTARNLENDQARWHDIIDHVLNHWPKDPAQGLEAVLIGSTDEKLAKSEAPFWSVKAR